MVTTPAMTFVHEALLELEPGSDPRAPGAAVTAELCGHWEHAGRCRWPHLAQVARADGRSLTLRVLFAAPLTEEAEVRARLSAALRRGRVEGAPLPSAWTVRHEGPAALRPEEAPAAEKLLKA